MAKFVSKAELRGMSRRVRRFQAGAEAKTAEAMGTAPKVYRNVSEANPNLSHNEVRRISHEANIRTAQSGMKRYDDPDLARKAARKALKMGAKASESLKGGAGVTKETVGALRRAVIGMGKFAAKGAAAGMPGELMEPVAKDAEKTAKEIRGRLKKRSLERRTKVAKTRLGY